LLDLFVGRKLYFLLISNQTLLTKVFDLCLANIKNDSFKGLIKILIKINENILKDFGSNIVTQQLGNTENQEFFFNYQVNNLISSNNNYQNENEENSVSTENMKSQLDLIFANLIRSTTAIIEDFIDDNFKEILHTTYDKKQQMLGSKKYIYY